MERSELRREIDRVLVMVLVIVGVAVFVGAVLWFDQSHRANEEAEAERRAEYLRVTSQADLLIEYGSPKPSH